MTATAASVTRPRLLRSLRAGGQHHEVVANSGYLVGTTVVTSLLGFVYWWVAAQCYPPEAVGYASAAVSAMTLLGTLGMLGLGTLLIGELARGRTNGPGLVSAALIAAGVGSAAIGLVLGLVLVIGRSAALPPGGQLPLVLLFALGVAATGATLVLDQALVGALLGRLQLERNMWFAGLKVLLVPVAAVLVADTTGSALLATWISGTVLSLAPIAVRLHRRGNAVVPPPDWATLRGLMRQAASHNWLNVAVQTPRLVLPVIVTVALSARANAGFYAAWMVLTFAYIIPTHLSTVLYAVGAADESVMRDKLRFTLRVSTRAGVLVVVAMVVGAGPLLRLFGPSYASVAAWPFRILAIGYFPNVVKAHYIAIHRVRATLNRAAAVMSAGAVIEVTAAIAGAHAAGLAGLSVALLLAMVAEAVVTAPTVLRCAGGRAAPSYPSRPPSPSRRESSGHGTGPRHAQPARNDAPAKENP